MLNSPSKSDNKSILEVESVISTSSDVLSEPASVVGEDLKVARTRAYHNDYISVNARLWGRTLCYTFDKMVVNRPNPVGVH